MSETSPYVKEVTAQDFDAVVLEGSRQVPVLVDFWAAWCAPCRMLAPVLEALAAEYGGKFVLAKVNTDDQQELAARYGVRSLPTVKVFRDGQPVDEFMGAQPEGAVREVLERHVERASDQMRQRALEAYQRGQAEDAVALLQTAVAEDPGNLRVHMDLLQLLMQEGRVTEAWSTFRALPADKQMEPEMQRLAGRLEFAAAAAEAPPEAELRRRVEVDADDLEARYQLAARAVMAERWEEALDQLLAIMQADRGFRDDAGRKGLVAVFEILGNQGPLVSRYRSRMSSLLY